jgi:hypothetical protein
MVYNVKGEIPQTDDERIVFKKGLFQVILPSFLNNFSTKNQLVMHCDASLYSSTLYILTCLDKFIIPGTIIIFGQFYSAASEFRAFKNYVESYYKNYELRATAQKEIKQAAIEIIKS